jgi:hypothetical protein
MGASPQAVDWDEDGDFDLLSGEYTGYVNLFRNVGSATRPVLTYEGHVQANKSDIDVGLLSVPVVNDWNEDGRKDLVVGMDAGNVNVYLNIGTNEAPSFGSYFRVQADGGDINHAKNFPEVADLNEDGLKDLVMGWLDGSCLYWPNYGTNSDPVFHESYELVGFTDPVDPDPYNYNWSHMEVCDWDGDGHLDVLFTRWESEIFIHRNALSLIDITVDPVDPPIVIPPGGGSFNCNVTFSNSSLYDAVVDGWIEAILPGGGLYGPIRIVNDIPINGGGSRELALPQYVPGSAPGGIYSYCVYLGKEENGYFVSDRFDFEKQ